MALAGPLEMALRSAGINAPVKLIFEYREVFRGSPEWVRKGHVSIPKTLSTATHPTLPRKVTTLTSFVLDETGSRTIIDSP